MNTNLPKAKAFYYAFDHSGLPEALAISHVAYVKQALSNLFDIDPDSVRASSRDRVDEGAPFQLTAYETDSRTSAEAMAVAAKAVLPHLRATKAKAKCNAALVQGWTPGEDPAEDDAVTALVADGLTPTLSFAQRTWLIEQASAFGVGSGDIEMMTDAQLAAIVSGGWLTALLRVDASKAKRTLRAARAERRAARQARAEALAA